MLLKHSIAYATPSVPVRLPGKRQANGLPDEFAAFSETLRNEVDLNRLREQLVEVVQETMEPAHISLWLRKPESFDARKTRVLPAIGDYWGEQ